MIRPSGTSRPRPAICSVLVAVLIAVLGTTSACRAIQRKIDKVDMSQRIGDAPPIRLDTIDGRHLLVMQAPNPGWSFSIDRTEISSDGRRVFITIRRPDPAYMYPQVIVEKQLLTDVRAEVPITLMARLLDAHETTSGRSHTVIEPVERFED